MGKWMSQWVGQWMGPGQIIKNRINLDLIEIIQFCLKIYDLRPPPMGGCMGGWVDGCINMWVNGWGKVISLTRKPVGFMQSCCFVFVGILSTYK